MVGHIHIMIIELLMKLDVILKNVGCPVTKMLDHNMSNGLVAQLPSSHLFIHRVLTKLSYEVVPHGVNFCQLQLLFVLTLTDQFHMRNTD